MSIFFSLENLKEKSPVHQRQSWSDSRTSCYYFCPLEVASVVFVMGRQELYCASTIFFGERNISMNKLHHRCTAGV